VECHRTTGEDCFIMKVYFVAMEELDGVLDQFLAHADDHLARPVDSGAAA
jgi:DNA-binding Lrp family transcriptional regulator